MKQHRLKKAPYWALMAGASLMSVSFGSVAADAAFQNCLSNLRSSAVASGVSGQAFDQYTANLDPDMSVIEKLDYQPEFSTPIWDYLSGLVDQERVYLGKTKLQQYSSILKRVEVQYGVDAASMRRLW